MNTESVDIGISAYLSLLAVDCTLVNVRAATAPLPVQRAFSLSPACRSFAGSTVGSTGEIQEVLDF
ncbi:hypothetical protein [Sanguibacter sp. 25GB23B1]|uniref:hypothetical protein n=1 Tax=unclassified Sanguibacter TaxID=2645534 RepID=UPI0032AF6136